MEEVEEALAEVEEGALVEDTRVAILVGDSS